MEVKEAVKIALDYTAEVFSAESLSNIGLEEIVYDELEPQNPVRHYKIVKVNDEDGRVASIRRHRYH